MNCWRGRKQRSKKYFTGKIIRETTLTKLHTLFYTSNQISLIRNQINKQ